MNDSVVLVNLHTHSNMSDGQLSPEDLAEMVSAAGVSFASLTDHDTSEGSKRFRLALARCGVGCIDGVEMTVSTVVGEAHLLAYGIDIENDGFTAMLPAVNPGDHRGERRNGPRSSGIPAIEDAIKVIHAAGGAAFLAHPLHFQADMTVLKRILENLAPSGLDGIEAIYAGYDGQGQARLLELADSLNLASSAGGDFHAHGEPNQAKCMEMDAHRWRVFRDVLLKRSLAVKHLPPLEILQEGMPKQAKVRGRKVAFHIIVPAVSAIVLFALCLFVLIIPRVEAMMLEQKKEMIRELTDSALSIIAEYEVEAASGRMTLASAQVEAVKRLRDVRYGHDNKDYFWITDMEPRMIMHTYRADLEGKNLTDFRDENGLRVFVEFVKAVKEKDEGYVEYLWQWKDDSDRIVPKLSFVKRFAPWGWVIGTGIYLDDVRVEIDALSGSLILICVAISLIMSLFITYMARQNLSIERGKNTAQAALKESSERYRALAEGATDGTVIVVGGLCSFANGVFLDMTGYSQQDIQLLRASELLVPHSGESEFDESWFLAHPSADGSHEALVEGRLKTSSGIFLDVIVSKTPFQLAGREGAVISINEANPRISGLVGLESDASDRFAEISGIGSFRARWSKRAGILEADPTAMRILGIAGNPENIGLFSLIPDAADAQRLYDDLAATGAANRRRLRVGAHGSLLREAVISAFLSKDTEGETGRIEGFIEDNSELAGEERRLERRAARMEAESLWLTAPVSRFAHEALTCLTTDTAREVSKRMGELGRSELIVNDTSGNALGMVTSGDLSVRLIARGLDSGVSAGTLMTAPLITAGMRESLSSALEAMRDSRTRRVAVCAANGAITGIINAADVAMLHAGSFQVLRDAIPKAESMHELIEIARMAVESMKPSLAAGASAYHALGSLSSVQDAIIAGLAKLTMEKLGAAPASWCFLSLGSMGREERIPLSDHDDALVWVHSGGDLDSQRGYFAALGAGICEGLELSGCLRCHGGVMASNRNWNAPLHEWETRLARGIREPESEKLLDLQILFDFRAAAGSGDIAASMRKTLFSLLRADPAFFIHFSKDACERRIPGGSFRGTQEFSLKDSSALFSAFARVYALKAGIDATNTHERFDALADCGIMPRGTRDDILDAFETVMGARLSRALDRRTRGGKQDGEPYTEREQVALNRALGQAALLQKKISFDFLGSAL